MLVIPDYANSILLSSDELS